MTTQYGPKDVINLADEGQENGYSGLAETLLRYAAAWEVDRAALEAAKSQREAYKLSVYELREQLRNSVSEEALASAQDDLAGCRAALERARALLAEVESARYSACMFCGANFDTGHTADCRLAALLATGSGGAA